METEHRKVRDPVCGMEVDPRQLATEYLGLHFAFCSVQCRDRFLANPHLYIGVPGHKAPKQEGVEVLKRRRLKLAQPLSPELAARVIAQVQAMMGIKRVEVEGRVVDITYDLLEATEAQIEAQIANAGASLGGDLAERLRRAFVHYVEETEIDNLEVRPTPHAHGH